MVFDEKKACLIRRLLKTEDPRGINRLAHCLVSLSRIILHTRDIYMHLAKSFLHTRYKILFRVFFAPLGMMSRTWYRVICKGGIVLYAVGTLFRCRLSRRVNRTGTMIARPGGVSNFSAQSKRDWLVYISGRKKQSDVAPHLLVTFPSHIGLVTQASVYVALLIWLVKRRLPVTGGTEALL